MLKVDSDVGETQSKMVANSKYQAISQMPYGRADGI